jgi:hypothetical protein
MKRLTYTLTATAGVVALTAGSVAFSRMANGGSFAARLHRESLHRAGVDGSKNELWYFFRLEDCKVGDRQIRALNNINAQGRVVVRGVLLDVPTDSTERRDLARTFGATFTLTMDTDRVWSRDLAAAGYSPPLYAVRDNDRLTAVLTPQSGAWARLRVEDPVQSMLDRQTSDVTLRDGRRPLIPSLRHVDSIMSSTEQRLINPFLVAADRDRIYVVDFGDHLIKAFSTGGRLLWTYGDLNRGQLNLAVPTSLTLNTAGQLVVFDAPEGMIIRLRRDGILVDTTRVRRPVQRVVETERGYWGFDPLNEKIAALRLDATGRPEQAFPLPAPFADVDQMSRATVVAGLPGSDSAVVGYQNNDYLALWGGAGAPRMARGVEDTPIPPTISWTLPNGDKRLRLAPSAVDGTMAITTDSQSVYVLYGGTTPRAHRVVDVYDRRSMVYRGTYELSKAAVAIARTPDGFVSVSARPNASIDMWQFQRKR